MNELEYYQEALTPLVNLYPKCPLNFLVNEISPITIYNGELLNKFKLYLSHLYDRTTVPSTFIQANALYIGFITDIIEANKGTSLANFPEIEKYPNTEESKIVASVVRAAINGCFGMENFYKSSPWPNYFWNRGLELEDCNFEGVDNDG